MRNLSENIFYFSIALWGFFFFFWVYNSQLRLHSLSFILLLRSYIIRIFSLGALKILSLSLVCFTLTMICVGMDFFFNLTWDLLDFLNLWIRVFHYFWKMVTIISTNISSVSFPPFSPLKHLYLDHLILFNLSFILSILDPG